MSDDNFDVESHQTNVVESLEDKSYLFQSGHIKKGSGKNKLIELADEDKKKCEDENINVKDDGKIVIFSDEIGGDSCDEESEQFGKYIFFFFFFFCELLFFIHLIIMGYIFN
jgi:hypothetical protein